MRPNRRGLLACLPAMLTPAGAWAFRAESPVPSVAVEYGAACGSADVHDSLRAELSRLVDGRPLPTGAEEPLRALARCPRCGCSVLGAPDRGTPERPGPG